MIRVGTVLDRSTNKFSSWLLLILTVCLVAIGVNLGLVWYEYKSLRDEAMILSSSVSQSSLQEVSRDVNAMGRLLGVIDECGKVFKDEGIVIRTYNLESIREEVSDQIGIYAAMVSFRIQGHWEGIEKALNRLENMTGQAVFIEEIALDQVGGEVLLKIYYLGF